MSLAIQTKFQQVVISDVGRLASFYDHLPDDTQLLFQPHPFQSEELLTYLRHHYRYRGFISIRSQQIVGYVACYLGHFEHDVDRFKKYNFQLSLQKDAQFAPVVDPDFRGTGLAQEMMKYVSTELKKTGINRLMLWGGVKADNNPAVTFYKKSGFKEIGRFEHEGQNIDMYFPIT